MSEVKKFYVVVSPDSLKKRDPWQDAIDQITDSQWFDNKEKARVSIDLSDPDEKWAWDIYEVQVTCVESL